MLASADATVKKGINQSVTIPIFATLIAGSRYRIAYFIPAGQGSFGDTADVFDPAPDGLGGFPYIELNGLLRLEEAFSIASDTFPTNPNTAVPMFKVKIRQPNQ